LDDLDATIRRADPDRWLASRFAADPLARADLIALYAFNHELARATEAAHEPLVQEIRLTWWREALDEIFAGRPPRRHPAVEALAETIRRRGLPPAPFEALIEARIDAIEAPITADEATVHRHIDATAGTLMGLAATVLDPTASPGATQAAARAWGLAGLARLRRTGTNRLPKAWDEAEIRRRVRAVTAEARAAARQLPVAAFPAVAYATLANAYAAGRAPSDLEKRLRLTTAVLTGRL
jgi:15-cis-phytoene synthase